MSGADAGAKAPLQTARIPAGHAVALRRRVAPQSPVADCSHRGANTYSRRSMSSPFKLACCVPCSEYVIGSNVNSQGLSRPAGQARTCPESSKSRQDAWVGSIPLPSHHRVSARYFSSIISAIPRQLVRSHDRPQKFSRVRIVGSSRPGIPEGLYDKGFIRLWRLRRCAKRIAQQPELPRRPRGVQGFVRGHSMGKSNVQSSRGTLVQERMRG